MRETLLYRHLHGAPQVMGIPVHQVLVLVTVGTLGALVVNQWSGRGALGVAAAMVGVGLGLNLVHGQDRIVLPMVKLRMRHRFQARVSSFAPSYQRVDVGEE